MAWQILIPMRDIEEFCYKWRINRMWIFGSALRDDFGPQSDVDVLVEFAPEAKWNLLDLTSAEQELSKIMGRPVDLVERQCVEQSENWLRRRHILESAEGLYVAR